MRAYLLVPISLAVIIIAGVTIQPAFADAACTGTFCVDGGGNGNIASATYTTVSGGNATLPPIQGRRSAAAIATFRSAF